MEASAPGFVGRPRWHALASPPRHSPCQHDAPPLHLAQRAGVLRSVDQLLLPSLAALLLPRLGPRVCAAVRNTVWRLRPTYGRHALRAGCHSTHREWDSVCDSARRTACAHSARNPASAPSNLPARARRRSRRAPATLYPRPSTRGVTAAPPSPRQQRPPNEEPHSPSGSAPSGVAEFAFVWAERLGPSQ
eukprot:COSAG02_NODE_16281_length_1097_cov_2.030090_1_plen_190_part_00